MMNLCEKAYPTRVNVIDVPVSVVNMCSALEFVANHLEQLRGEYVCAANAHTTVMAHEIEDYLKVQCQAVLTLPDGKPLSVIGKKKTGGGIEKVTGTHFMQNIFTDSRFAGRKHFFYGTSRDDIDAMIANVHKEYPHLDICGYEPSVFRELSDAEVDALAERINAADADFVWVALGAPRQEYLMYRLRGKTCGVMTGVGGAFRILAGSINDAPLWMQNAGLEWFYRLCKEPRRLFTRYLITNTKFIYYLLTSK